MTNYNNGKIYKIIDNTNGSIYIGSTCHSLVERLGQHLRHYNKYLANGKKYISSFEIVKNGNFKIELIENYCCNTKQELHKRERFYIESNKCVNIVIPTRAHEEYRKEYYLLNKEEILAKQKSYNEENKEKNSERKKKYYEKNKDVIKAKNDLNKENKSEYNKKYIEENRDKVYAKRLEKVECECGCVVSYEYMTKHLKTDKHKEMMECKSNQIDYETLKEIQQKEASKTYYANNKESIQAYKLQYSENNKDKISEYHKYYWEENKEKIKAKQSETINCECGITYTKTNKARHCKTKHHINFMENLNP